jgi:hypothetical protein
MALDLVPMADRVMVAVPSQPDPFLDAAVLEVHGRRGGEALGTVVRDGGYGRHAEPARLIDGPDGTPVALRLGGWRLEPEAAITASLKRRVARRR